MNSPSTIEVIVLSYNRPDNLRHALRSISAQTRRAWRITVVDNRSERSAAIAGVVAEYPGVRLVPLSENTGYSGGMNRGLRDAKGDFVYLTEDDIVLPPDVLEKLAAVAEADPRAGLVGAVICDQDHPERIICAGGEIELGGVFRLNFHTSADSRNDVPGVAAEVGFLPGNSIFARRELLQRLGGFRDEFFMYLEDVELCLRVAKTGRRILIVPGARVQHIGFQANMNPTINFHRLKNLHAVYVLHAPASVMPSFCLRSLHTAIGRAARFDKVLAGAHWRALGWTLRSLPRLWRERRALRGPGLSV